MVLTMARVDSSCTIIFSENVDIRTKRRPDGDTLGVLIIASAEVVDTGGFVDMSVAVGASCEDILKTTLSSTPFLLRTMAPDGNGEALFNVDIEVCEACVSTIKAFDDGVGIAIFTNLGSPTVVRGPDVVFPSRIVWRRQEYHLAGSDGHVLPNDSRMICYVGISPVVADVHGL